MMQSKKEHIKQVFSSFFSPMTTMPEFRSPSTSRRRSSRLSTRGEDPTTTYINTTDQQHHSMAPKAVCHSRRAFPNSSLYFFPTPPITEVLLPIQLSNTNNKFHALTLIITKSTKVQPASNCMHTNESSANLKIPP